MASSSDSITELRNFSKEQEKEYEASIRQSLELISFKRANLSPLPGWEKPRLFIEAVEEGGFKVDEEIAQQLLNLRKEVVVIGIVGPYRTAKSALLNMFIGMDAEKGFGVSNLADSKTHGIWIWCYNHPVKRDATVIFMDTEGFGDVMKTPNDSDNQIFVLTALLSSTLLYNSVGVLNSDAFDKIKIVGELANRIHMKPPGSQKSLDGDEEDLFNICPQFIWILRDFQLDLEGRTPDEYLDQALKPKKGVGAGIKAYNIVRECIAQYFPDRKCFILPPHRDGSNKGARTSLNQEFIDKVDNICKYLMEHSEPKSIYQTVIDGRLFGQLAKEYCNALTRGQTPCVLGACGRIIRNFNGTTLTEAKDVFDKSFNSDDSNFDSCAKDALNYMVQDKTYHVDFLLDLMKHMLEKAKLETNTSLNGDPKESYELVPMKGSTLEAEKWQTVSHLLRTHQLQQQEFLKTVLEDQRHFLVDMQKQYLQTSKHFLKEHDLAKIYENEQRQNDMRDILIDVDAEYKTKKEDCAKGINALQQTEREWGLGPRCQQMVPRTRENIKPKIKSARKN